MLVTSQPFKDHVVPPRVISEVRKGPAYYDLDFRPKLSGELLVKDANGGDANKTSWWPRRASIRNGQLNITSGRDGGGMVTVPLRGLSLRAGPLQNSLCLCKGQNVILTMQTCNSRSYEAWVRTIAIELIRQTPLEHIKYLDIFTLLDYSSVGTRLKDFKDCNSNILIDQEEPCAQKPSVELRCCACRKSSKEHDEAPEANEEDLAEDKLVEKLLKKCQNPECYVPVRDKLVLFESLCKMSRKVRSSEDVSSFRLSASVVDGKRATSMHDLTNFKAVREICKYFERVSNENKYGTMTRFNRVSAE